ncbi:unnamed protein product [Hydatigera taeniaeformis]|uniref:Arginyl-tRNA--protein transferase 1 n=1 Tax=Hydatigena taeniaeformis TaxID=6205 RepID=A0A0R3WUE0_HYDTA|nr:unnamed protein product [Hydatigera taeniaeformis]
MMNLSNPSISLITLEGEMMTDSCRYCDDVTLPKSKWYMSSRVLNVDDYRLLMDCGWRRHGNRIYKTMNEKTCCPVYTIRCDTEHFKISKSQKRVLNIVSNFLAKGEKPSCARKFQRACTASVISAEQSNTASPLSSKGGCHKDTGDDIKNRESAAITGPTDSDVSGCRNEEPTSGLPRSSQPKRWQANRESATNCEAFMQTCPQTRKDVLKKNKAKDIEDYLHEEGLRDDAVHTLDIRLYPCAPLSFELEATLDEEYKLYRNYQVSVHGASPASLSREAFNEFLVESTLASAHDAAAETAGAPQFGSYHQQYWLDGNTLIAVGVLDLVPGCLSSVYFFYHPDYAFLSLGTYSALREIAFVRHLHQKYASVVPSYADFTQYYMGYYVHSSPKMRYKAQFSPSYLACPETYVWVPMEKCKHLLDQCKYSRLAGEEAENASPTHSYSNTKILLPFCEALISALPKDGFVVEGDAIVTTLAEAEGVLSRREVQLVNEWIRLVNGTGTIHISCTI